MSQSGSYYSGGSGSSGVVTINSVPPDITGNIILNSVSGTLTFTPGTNSISIDTAGIIPDSFLANTGVAAPIAGVINIDGDGTSITTSATGNTITISVIPTGMGIDTINNISPDGSQNFTIESLSSTITITPESNGISLDIADSFSNSFLTDSGTATPSVGVLAITGGTGIETSAPGSSNIVSVALINDSITLNSGQNITVSGSPIALGGSGTIALSGIVPLANGGTNASSMANTDGVVYYDGTRLVTTAVGTATQVLTSNGSGMAPTFQSAASSSITIAGDTGTPQSGNSFTFNANTNAGSTVKFNATATDLITLNVTDANSNTLIGSGAGNASFTGSLAVALGNQALASDTSGSVGNIAIGYQALNAQNNVQGNGNVAIGQGALALLNGNSTPASFGAENTAVGTGALNSLTTGRGNTFIGNHSGSSGASTGGQNTALGAYSLTNLTTGNFNVAIGASQSLSANPQTTGAGINWLTSESSNIAISNNGVTGDNNVIRIGTQGTGNGQQSTCFIAGIIGNTISSAQMVTINSSGQLGAQAISSSGTVTSITAGTGITLSPSPITTTGSVSLTIPVVVSSGGTGAISLTGVLIGNGTSAVTGNPVTQFDVLIGGASNAITSIAPSSTTGIPLISQGSASNPAFGTTVVQGGGTGVTALTAYAPILGGTTTTGPVQQATSGFSNVGYSLVSNGNSAVPAWQTMYGFSASTSTHIDNITGAGATYVVVYDTVNFDTTGGYNPATGIFTAPIAGYYNFDGQVYIQNLTIANNSMQFSINTTSGQGAPGFLINPGVCMDVSNRIGAVATGVGFMNAGDTAQADLIVDGGASNTVGVGFSSQWCAFLVR